MNVGSRIGATPSPIVVGFLVRWSGSFTLAMYVFMGAAALSAIASLAIDYWRRITAREV